MAKDVKMKYQAKQQCHHPRRKGRIVKYQVWTMLRRMLCG
jgi:hypothetical protein